MQKLRVLVVLFVLSNLAAQASCPSGADTLKPLKDSTSVCKHHTTVKPTTDFDQRFSFIRNYSVNIWGQRGGILVNDEWKFGLGAYYMNDTRMNARVTNPSHYLKQNLLFGTAYAEPFLIRKKYWELSVPFEIGYGKAGSSTYESANDELIRTRSKDFIPTGAGLSLSLKFPSIGRFKPTSWVGVNFLAGYRYCLLENVFKTDYDGAFWSISGALFLDRIFDDMRARKRAKRGEAECVPQR
jgi:hypothetical protein